MDFQSPEALSRAFGFALSGDWPDEPLDVVAQAAADIYQALHLPHPATQSWLNHTRVVLEPLAYGGLTSRGLVRLNPAGLTTWTVVHEFGHAWDWSQFTWLSFKLKAATHSSGPWPLLHSLYPSDKRYWYRVGSPPPPCGCDRYFNRFEDFAESVAAFVYPEEAHRRAAKSGFPYEQAGYSSFLQTPRGQFITSLVDRQ
jgi:hypothetical protein